MTSFKDKLQEDLRLYGYTASRPEITVGELRKIHNSVVRDILKAIDEVIGPVRPEGDCEYCGGKVPCIARVHISNKRDAELRKAFGIGGEDE